MRTVLHVLPHSGGGAETYIDLLEGLEGYRHRRVPLSVTRSRLAGVPSVAARRRRIRRLAQGADLVHVHGDMAAMLIAPAMDGRPLLITTHGLHRLRRSMGASAWLVHRRLRAAVEASARTICIAGDERDDLAAVLPPRLRRRLVVVPNGVPLPAPTDPERRARARRSLGLGESEVAVLFAGQLEERKDPLGGISAVEAARARGADVVLLIAGEGPLEREVFAREGAAVRPLGHRDDMEELYAAADLFLLPSHREGMSFALLEAMAHGLAPIVADGTGNTETVEGAGAVFPAGDLLSMSDLLTGLAADAAARARLGGAARERVRAKLSVEKFLARTRDQYEAVLAEGAPHQGA
ncbi:MAG TPA: glycosyltransferase family 4 protein [Solirubrobacterales bacterium]|nr:glycosyltransferase family 4 protein [Solirubrobacterales bacterium]